jgi:uncharacterized protein with ParB-like and HNH nuclease domain
VEASTNIRDMLNSAKRIIVPPYQRAYSWETPNKESQRKTHTDVFLSDLDAYQKSNANTPYYFGHFLFEEKPDSMFHIIDGQQRLTTIVIYLSALFARLEQLQELTTSEKESYEDMVKRNETYRFDTVDYDKSLFRDYVVNRTKKDTRGLETTSAERIVDAFNYFKEKLTNKDKSYLTKMLEVISKAACTTHQVKSESEAIQMFIFQNNRGKKPSDLEIIKAQFMYNIHLHGGEDCNALIEDVKSRFETIYKTISSIEHNIDEDDVLAYTVRIYLNKLSVESISDAINKELAHKNPIAFITIFSQALSTSFEKLKIFFDDAEKHYEVHSLAVLGRIGIALPFVIKAYNFGLDVKEISRLCTALESLLLRHRLIGTRADLASRIDDVFEEFTADNQSIEGILERVEFLKNNDDGWWWNYWNNDELERSIQGDLSHSTAKFILWKYENQLRTLSEKGYGFYSYDKISNMELEHIAPSTEPNKKPHGYGKYDDDFNNNYLNCLGNYLLASKPHNISLSNAPFLTKRERYTELKQQTEVQELGINGIWNKKLIQRRKEKIIKFVMGSF